MKRFAMLIAAFALFAGLLVLPASAAPPGELGHVVFTGQATVCSDIVGPAPGAPGCPLTVGKKGNQPDNTSGNRGLFLPLINPAGKWQNVHGLYTFGSGPLSVDHGGPYCVKFGPFGVDTCTISVSGKLAPVAGIGAACGMSHGHSGLGTLAGVGNGKVYDLSNVGWPFSGGGTLPITGTYTTSATGGKNKGPGHRGPIVGVVQAQGGAACTGQPGASNFNVVGIVTVA